MEEPTEVTHSDGDIVWVKLGPCWWPGQVCGFDKLPPGLLKSFRKPPIAVVKFFQEESFEYVKNVNLIFKYNCPRKHEFIKKGLDLFRSKHSHMDKFPEDVCTAERLTDGNPDIITDDEFLPQKKESYANIFGSPNDSTNQIKKTPGKRGRPAGSPLKWKIKNPKSPSSLNNTPKITHPRILQKYLKGTSDYKAHILVQPRNSLDSQDSPDALNISLDDEACVTPKRAKVSNIEESPDRGSSATGIYSCHACNFTSTRLNVMILHNKSHSVGYVPYTPVKKPISKSPLLKSKAKSENISFHDDENLDYVDKKKKATKNKGRPKNLLDKIPGDVPSSPSKSQYKEKPLSPPKRKMKSKEKESKRPKTDVEIKNSLLADWNEDSDEESMDILTSLKLTENQNSSSSFIDKSEKKFSVTGDDLQSKIENNVTEKPEDVASKVEKREQASCFDFEEDEDLQIEKISRKIPRVCNKSDDIKKVSESNLPTVESESVVPASNVSEDAKSEISNSQTDAVDLDSEVDNLLKETAVPEVPLLLSESNFQKSKVVKVPDKDNDSQYIFKTKTFFRSRHSRGQDAIEKYVADNTSVDKPITYMDGSIDTDKSNTIDESTIKNDTDDSSKETAKESDTLKVTKFAPKIQLKKMKAALDTNKWTSDNKVQDSSEPIEGTSEFSSKISKAEGVCVDKDKEDSDNHNKSQDTPSESDLQIAETLINLPKSAVHESSIETANVLESKRLSQSEKKINDLQSQSNKVTDLKLDDGVDKSKEVIIGIKTRSGNLETKVSVSKTDVGLSDPSNESLKLFQTLDDSNKTKNKPQVKTIQNKTIKAHGKEKILNFDVGSSVSSLRKAPEDRNIIIRRKTSPLKLNTFDSTAFNQTPQELLLSSKSNKWNDDEVQTFTIEGASGSNEDLLDPKLKKVTKTNLIKPHISCGSELVKKDPKEQNITDEASLEMKIKPSTPSSENQISSDSFLISQSPKHSPNISETVKSESALTPENLEKSPQIKKAVDVTSPKRPKIIVKSPIEKTVSPNILSKSIKTKTMKQLVIVDKSLGEKHLIIPQSENNSQSFQAIEGLVKETSSLSQQVQKKKIIIDTSNLPVGKKSQKIILNTLPKGQVSIVSEGHSDIDVKQKVIPISSEQKKTSGESPGNTYMIITNSQGVQSKIVISPERHKLLFPKSKIVQQSNVSTKTSYTLSSAKSKTPQLVIGSDQIITTESISTLISNESQVHQISKPTTTLINSKGQFIMSSNSKRVLSTTPGQAILTSKGQIIAPQSSIITSTSMMPNISKSTLITSNSQNTLTSKAVQSQKVASKVTEILKAEKTLAVTSKVSAKPLTTKVVRQQIATGLSQIKEAPKKEKTLIINPSKNLAKAAANRAYGQTTTIIQAQIKDPKLYLGQKSGTITLTAAEFEHLQKTGQLVAKSISHKVIEPPNRVPSGKAQNQKFILKKVLDNKQIASAKSSNAESNKRKTETKTLSEVPPLTPINSEKSTTLLKKQKPSNTKLSSGYNCNNVKVSDSEDSNSLENLDKLIPATIIPTRKRDATIPEVSDKDSNNVQEVKDNTKKTVDNANENLSLSANSLPDPQKQLLAIPGENFGGPPNSFFLCVEENGTLTPVDNQPLVLENNQLVPMTIPSLPAATPSLDSETVLMTTSELPNVIKDAQVETSQILELPVNQTQQNILINTGDQQLLVDHQTFLSLLSGNEQIVLPDGQHLVLQGGTHQFLNEELAKLFTDNQQGLVNATGNLDAISDSQKMIVSASGENVTFSSDVQSNQDILAAALAGTEVFESDNLIHETINVTSGVESGIIDMDSLSPNLQNVSTTVHSNVFETSSTLNQPIMSPLEHPSKNIEKTTNSGLLAISKDTKINAKNLEDGLAVIGVATTNVPTSLELPITVTNPRIAAKTTSSLNTVYQSGLLTNAIVSPGIAIFDSEVSVTDSSSPQKQKSESVKEKTESSLLSEIDMKKNVTLENSSVVNEDIEDSIASSMPCLDDANIENSNNTQTAENIETKTYSPISMPILTDDPVMTTTEVTENESNTVVDSQTVDLDSLETKPETPIDDKNKEESNISQMESVPFIGEGSVPGIEKESMTENVPAKISDVSIEPVEVTSQNNESENCKTVDNSLNHDNEVKTEDEKTDHDEDVNHDTSEDLKDTKSEICAPSPNSQTESVVNTEHENVEVDEICVETPPEFTQPSPVNYEEQDTEEPVIQNETEENSIPDHTCEVSSGMATVPDSTISSVDTVSTTPEPPVSSMFSESSSDASTEIPMQPEITVSHHLVQNFSSLLNNSSLEDKSSDCANSENKVSGEFENDKSSVTDSYEVDGKR